MPENGFLKPIGRYRRDKGSNFLSCRIKGFLGGYRSTAAINQSFDCFVGKAIAIIIVTFQYGAAISAFEIGAVRVKFAICIVGLGDRLVVAVTVQFGRPGSAAVQDIVAIDVLSRLPEQPIRCRVCNLRISNATSGINLLRRDSLIAGI